MQSKNPPPPQVSQNEHLAKRAFAEYERVQASFQEGKIDERTAVRICTAIYRVVMPLMNPSDNELMGKINSAWGQMLLKKQAQEEEDKMKNQPVEDDKPSDGWASSW